MVRIRLLVLGVVALIAGGAVPAGAAQWRYEALDGTGAPPAGRTGNDVGGSPGGATLYCCTPHLFYSDDTAHDLRHAFWTGAAWAYEVLDGTPTAVASGRIPGDVGTQTSVVQYLAQPHVFYFDDSGNDLRHAWYDGAQWRAETLDGSGANAYGRTGNSVARDGTAAVLYGGTPHVFYSDDTASALRHGWWTGNRWQFETLDGASGSVASGARAANGIGARPTAISYRGAPHVFSYDTTADELRHAWWTGNRWMAESLDGFTGSDGRVNRDVGSSNAAGLYYGQPHAFYRDDGNGDLRHAWYDGTKWRFEILDGDPAGRAVGKVTGDVGADPALTFFDGQPHVFHYRADGGDLMHAWWTGSQWRAETLESGGDVGRFPVALMYQFAPHVFYADVANGQLRHAWYG